MEHGEELDAAGWHFPRSIGGQKNPESYWVIRDEKNKVHGCSEQAKGNLSARSSGIA